MRLNVQRRFELAITEDFDQVVLPGESLLHQELLCDVLLTQPGQAVQIDDPVLDAKDVGEAALGQAAMQWHLSTFKTAQQPRSRTGSLSLMAAGGGLAHAAAHAASHPLAV